MRKVDLLQIINMPQQSELHSSGSNCIQSKQMPSSQKSSLRKCPNCSKTFQKTSKYMRHLRGHLSCYTYECDVCSICFNSKKVLQEHKKSHNNLRKFQCDRCPKVFNHAFGLSKHMLVHTDEEHFTCFICPAKFSTVSARSRHVKNHVISCGLCSLNFKTIDSFQDHLLKTHRCNRSGKIKSVMDLEKNVVSVVDKPPESVENSNQNKLICFICQDLFFCPKSLQDHLKSHKIFNCLHCPKFFASDKLLQHHQSVCPSSSNAETSTFSQITTVDTINFSTVDTRVGSATFDEDHTSLKNVIQTARKNIFCQQLDICDAPFLNFGCQMHIYWLLGYIEEVKCQSFPLDDGCFRKLTHIHKSVADALSSGQYGERSFLPNIFSDINKLICDHLQSKVAVVSKY